GQRSLFSVREFHQGGQFGGGGAGVNGVGGQGHGVRESIGAAGGDQGGGGVHKHDIAARRFFPGKNFSDDFGIGVEVAAEDRAERGALQPELLGLDFIKAHPLAADLADTGGAGDGDFIQAVL